MLRLKNGTLHSRERAIPIGAAGPDTRANHAELVRTKFRATGGSDEVADIAADLALATPAEVRFMLEEALSPVVAGAWAA
jgi:hypothetical protein